MEKLLRDYFDKKLSNYDYRGNTELQEKIEDMIDDSIEQAMEILRMTEKKVDNTLEDLEADYLPSRQQQYFDWMGAHQDTCHDEYVRLCGGW